LAELLRAEQTDSGRDRQTLDDRADNPAWTLIESIFKMLASIKDI
jgi:hypothetical protein